MGMELGEKMPQIEPWYSVEDIARHLGVSKETIYRWLEREVIPAHRMGKLWKFKRGCPNFRWGLRGTAFPRSLLLSDFQFLLQV
jgi:excisionase family DNA binding protein